MYELGRYLYLWISQLQRNRKGHSVVIDGFVVNCTRSEKMRIAFITSKGNVKVCVSAHNPISGKMMTMCLWEIQSI